jgi:hypothetical protein
MKNINLFEEFTSIKHTNAQLDGKKKDKPSYVDINDISTAFDEFFEKMNEYAEFMDKDTLKVLSPAMAQLNEALKNETAAHGVRFEAIKIKF